MTHEVETMVHLVNERLERFMEDRGRALAQGSSPKNLASPSGSDSGSEFALTGEGDDTPDSAEALRSVPLASFLDHTVLKPEATLADVARAVEEALQFGFYSVCVNGCFVHWVAARLRGSQVKTVSVVGFPLGAMTTQAKIFEARDAVRNGAAEIDMVMNVGALKMRRLEDVLSDLRGVVAAVAPIPVKVILETSKLDDDEKLMACTLAAAAGAGFVKTSTGFGGGGATIQDIALMRKAVGPDMGVKASGGVRTRTEALAMIKAGATRIGTSSSVQIVTEGGAADAQTPASIY